MSAKVQHIWIYVSRNHNGGGCFRVQRIFGCALALVLSTSANRDCMTRSCKPCFLSVRQMTLASAGGITVAAAFSCHAFHCLETASRNSSFSRPFRPCHCFSFGSRRISREMRRVPAQTRLRVPSSTSIPFLFFLFVRKLWHTTSQLP